jgi:hypothetical protein
VERVFIGATRAEATRMADEWWARQKGELRPLLSTSPPAFRASHRRGLGVNGFIGAAVICSFADSRQRLIGCCLRALRKMPSGRWRASSRLWPIVEMQNLNRRIDSATCALDHRLSRSFGR